MSWFGFVFCLVVFPIFKMPADLKGGVAGGLTQVATLGSGKGGIPFAIEGTMSNPHFIPDMKGVAAGVAQGALAEATGAKNALQGNRANAIGSPLGKTQK
jgi:hypothetical protein